MARKVQRNDPCPCGSGKKYKKCCQIKENAIMAGRSNRRRGIQIALGWVSHAYEEPIAKWVDDVWLEGMSEEQNEGIGSDHPAIRGIHDVNLLVYFVAEGHLVEVECEDMPL